MTKQVGGPLWALTLICFQVSIISETNNNHSHNHNTVISSTEICNNFVKMRLWEGGKEMKL